MVYDIREEVSGPHWVLRKLKTTKHEEIVSICVVLWGIWYWRNKRVWSNQFINPGIAMENSFNILRDWKTARHRVQKEVRGVVRDNIIDRSWKLPRLGTIKLNVDASYRPEASTFSIGMVIHNHENTFIEGQSMTLPRPSTVFEAECIGVREALSWLQSYQG